MNFHNLFQIIFAEPIEDDDFINAIQKFRSEVRPQRVHYQTLTSGPGFFFGDVLAADIGRHDDDRIFEIDRSSLPVRDAAIIKHLKQDVENVRVCLLDFIEQHHRIRPAPDRLGQLSAFLVSDVTRRSADQTRDGVLLHVFAHINANHCVLVVKQEFGESTGELSFSNSGRSEKNK